MRVKDVCDFEVGFGDSYKDDNIILTLVSRPNRIIDWMVRNIISRERNVIFAMKEYCNMSSNKWLSAPCCKECFHNIWLDIWKW